MTRISITKTFRAEAAHRLPFHEGKCKSLHGHSYRIEVTVERDSGAHPLDDNSMVVDFQVITDIIGKWIQDHIDHATMVSRSDNALLTFLRDTNQKCWVIDDHPTAEMIAWRILSEARYWIALHDRNLAVTRVIVHETETSKATAEEENPR